MTINEVMNSPPAQAVAVSTPRTLALSDIQNEVDDNECAEFSTVLNLSEDASMRQRLLQHDMIPPFMCVSTTSSSNEFIVVILLRVCLGSCFVR